MPGAVGGGGAAGGIREISSSDLEVVEQHLHVDRVESIDEMACRLPSNLNGEEVALGIAARIKGAMRRELGEFVKCSIGIAPNRFLAKVGSDMQKPDGLVVLRGGGIEGEVDGVAGAGLAGGWGKDGGAAGGGGGGHDGGVVGVFGGIDGAGVRGRVGRYFWRNLHGEMVEEGETMRGSLSHSNVLSPERRTAEGARACWCGWCTRGRPGCGTWGMRRGR